MVTSLETIRVLDACRTRGIVLRVYAGQVRWTAPTGAMSVDLLRSIKANESGLVAVLTRTRSPAPARSDWGDSAS